MAYRKMWSTSLAVAQAERFADGALIALRKGKWLNRYITLNFTVAELQNDARPFHQWYLKQSREWLAYRDAGPLGYIAAFENKGGFHVHMLKHVPYYLWADYLAAEVGWIKHGLEKRNITYQENTLWDVPVTHYEDLVQGHALVRDYLKQLRRLILYHLKGATQIDTPAFLGMDEDERDELKSTSLPSSQGKVLGRRVSISHILLPGKASPPLRFGPRRPWLDEAEQAAEAGRDLHRKTLTLGAKSGKRPRAQPGAGNGAHRRLR